MQASTSTLRHSWLRRFLHWLNAALITIALMTGLQIFNAHPQLYWGQAGSIPAEAVAEFYPSDAAVGPAVGYLRIGHTAFATAGIFGNSADTESGREFYAFPHWATIPGGLDLGAGRRWHFIMAWMLVCTSGVFLLATAKSGYLRRELVPKGGDFDRQRNVRARYNPLQKLAYSVVIFLLGPLLLATGLTMSPGLDAAWPWLPELFGGRQSARTLHFGAAMTVVAFVVAHITMVAVSDPVTRIRAMVTGRFTPESSG